MKIICGTEGCKDFGTEFDVANEDAAWKLYEEHADTHWNKYASKMTIHVEENEEFGPKSKPEDKEFIRIGMSALMKKKDEILLELFKEYENKEG